MVQPASEALLLMHKLYKKLQGRRLFAEQMDHAYRGKHKLYFATEKWREYHEARYRDFSDNWCAPVANSPNERLRVNGFRLDDDPAITSSERDLWRDWQANDMEVQSSQGFLGTLITSRSAVLVWGDENGDPTCSWEDAAEVYVAHDPENPRRRIAAVKTWYDDDTEYATLYTCDAVWKWERPYERVATPEYGIPPQAESFFWDTDRGFFLPSLTAGTWKARQPFSDDTWPVPNPLGELPIVEFQNRPMLSGGPISEIAGTLAMQHAINLLWAYLFNAADHASFPARVVMGQEPPVLPILDSNGVKIGEKSVDLKKFAEDRILWLTGEKTTIGQFDKADLAVFTAVIETAVAHVAAQTRTPPHYLILGKGMVNVSAEGMKAAETGLVMKVQEEQLFFTPPTRDVMRLMALVRGNKGVADQCRFGAVQWKDAENRSIAQLVDALLKMQTIGFPFEWIAEQYGLSDTELQRVLAMKQKELAADPLGQISHQLGQQLPSEPPPEPPPVN